MKSKNHKRRVKAKEKKHQMANCDTLHVGAATQLPSKLALLASKYDHLKPTDPLYEMHQTIANKLKRKFTPDDSTLINRDDTAEENQVESADKQVLPSKKQMRLAAKPNIAQLKSLTNRPELIEWFDCDAKYPTFLVNLKTVPYAVQVPPNWRNRQEIPQFGPKPVYELPEPMKQTKIQELRATRAEKARNFTESQRTPGQNPPHFRLDLDYELMHSAFFGSSAVYETPLLPFGEIVDLKLRKMYKPSTLHNRTDTKSAKHKMKPPISQQLRSALGIGPRDAVPWQSYIDKNGLAPGFAAPSTKLWGELIDY